MLDDKTAAQIADSLRNVIFGMSGEDSHTDKETTRP